MKVSDFLNRQPVGIVSQQSVRSNAITCSALGRAGSSIVYIEATGPTQAMKHLSQALIQGGHATISQEGARWNGSVFVVGSSSLKSEIIPRQDSESLSILRMWHATLEPDSVNDESLNAKFWAMPLPRGMTVDEMRESEYFTGRVYAILGRILKTPVVPSIVPGLMSMMHANNVLRIASQKDRESDTIRDYESAGFHFAYLNDSTSLISNLISSGLKSNILSFSEKREEE